MTTQKVPGRGYGVYIALVMVITMGLLMAGVV
jgi:hypothetical protein